MRLAGPWASVLAVLIAVVPGLLEAGDASDVGDGSARRKRPPLVCRTVCQTNAVRSEAPALVELSLENNTKRAIQGRLRFTVSRDGSAVATLAGPEVYVPEAVNRAGRHESGESRLTTFLPIPSQARAGYSVHVRLEGSRDWDLGSHGLAFSARKLQRNLVLGLCTDRVLARDQRQQDLFAALRWRSYDPRKHFGQLGDHGSGGSTLARIGPDGLPIHPIGLLAFDLLVLRADALAALIPDQLQALAVWLRAGGALIVESDGGLPSAVGKWAAELGVEVDDEHRLPAGFVPHRVGLGRLLTVGQQEFDPSLWHRWGAWAWGFRRDRRQEIVSEGDGVWNGERVSSMSWLDGDQDRYGRNAFDPVTAAPQPFDYRESVIQMLEPQSVRLVPFELIVGVLICFVLAIGPVDYLLLGLLRLRRLTWLSFPLLSVACTMLVALASRHYMGTADHMTRLVVCDLAPDGTVARLSRYEHHFLAANGTVRVDLDGGVFDLIDLRSYIVSRGRGGLGASLDSLPMASVSGSPYGRQEIAFQGYKWTPTMNRCLHLAPDHQPPVAVDLPALEAAVRDGTLGSGGGGDLVAGAGIVDHTALYVLRGRSGARFFGSFVLGEYNLWQNWPAPPDCDLRLTYLTRELIVALTVAAPKGIHSRLAALAPHGGRYFEDLPFLDPSDPNAMALVVVHLDGDDLWLIRQPLYLAEEP